MIGAPRIVLLLIIPLVLMGSRCVTSPPEPGVVDDGLLVLDGDRRLSLEAVLPRLGEKRVVYVGERHDRYDHHLNQLELIRQLHGLKPYLAIGLEQIQQPFQPWLDGYISGAVDERTLLEKAQYYRRWGYDYRLYRPILRYAREQRIPLVALNVPTEISRKVAERGLTGLSAPERLWAPQVIDRSNKAYEARLRAVFQRHPETATGNFQNFLETQLLWDESMAERAARFLRENPERSLVVLAGEGHLLHGWGIPSRVRQRLPVESAIVLQQDADQEPDPRGADYLLLTQERRLPPSGRLGVILDSAAQGVVAQDFMDPSPAQEAGLQSRDRIIAVGGHPVEQLTDLRLALQDRHPGETVSVTVQRQGQAGVRRHMELPVTLH